MRRVEIIAIERERVVVVAPLVLCPVCGSQSELLSVAQAAEFAQVKTQSVRRWLAKNLAHGVKTIGGRHRVCKNSLFTPPVSTDKQTVSGPKKIIEGAPL